MPPKSKETIKEINNHRKTLLFKTLNVLSTGNLRPTNILIYHSEEKRICNGYIKYKQMSTA